MDNYHNIMSGRRGGVSLFVFVFVCVLMLPAGCSPRVIEHTHTEYVVSTLVKRDTVSTKDSVYIREWMKGDTVYIEKFKDRYYYRDRWRDSIQVREVHDTASVEVKVEKPLSPIQKAKIGAFWWLIALVLGLGAWTFRKPLLKLIKAVL